MKEEFDLSRFSSSAQAMFIAYARVDRLREDKVWLRAKYEQLKSMDKIRGTLEYFYMDSDARVALFKRFPDLNHADFESFRKLANAII